MSSRVAARWSRSLVAATATPAATIPTAPTPTARENRLHAHMTRPAMANMASGMRAAHRSIPATAAAIPAAARARSAEPGPRPEQPVEEEREA